MREAQAAAMLQDNMVPAMLCILPLTAPGKDTTDDIHEIIDHPHITNHGSHPDAEAVFHKLAAGTALSGHTVASLQRSQHLPDLFLGLVDDLVGEAAV